MRLEDDDFLEVASLYDLGTVRDVSLIDCGVVNFNYDLRTEGGRFVVRVLGKEAGEREKGEERLEFRVLDFLNDHDFPYAVPQPIENQKGDYLSTVSGEQLWVYPWIEGETVDTATDTQLRAMAEALATYHRTVDGMEIDEKPFQASDWLLEEYEKLQEIEAEDEIDRFVDDNAAFMQQVLHRLKDFSVDCNILPVHSDFIPQNLLFEEESVVGVVDFDRVQSMPRMHDIAYTVQIACFEDGDLDDRRMQLFLEAYQEHQPLEEEEKDALFPLIAVQNCYTFWWTYRKMEKRNQDRTAMLQENVAKTKNVLQKI